MSSDATAVDSEASDGRLAPEVGKSEVYEVDAGSLDTEALTRDIIRLSWELKALNSTAIDVRGRVSYTDFVVVCSGRSERHVKALVRQISSELRDAGWDSLSVEGADAGQWAILDVGDVVIHIFNAFQRDEYDLESMWVDADRLDFDDAPDDLYGHFQVERFE